jgi:hypothetical protein
MTAAKYHVWDCWCDECCFGRPAKAIEARSDATPKSDAARQGESAVASAICPTSSSIGDKL